VGFGRRDHYVIRGKGLERVNIVGMNRHALRSLSILAVFGLALVMIFKGYDAAVITAVVTATALAAADLASRIGSEKKGLESEKKGPDAP